jgi:hypothetical protein
MILYDFTALIVFNCRISHNWQQFFPLLLQVPRAFSHMPYKSQLLYVYCPALDKFKIAHMVVYKTTTHHQWLWTSVWWQLVALFQWHASLLNRQPNMHVWTMRQFQWRNLNNECNILDSYVNKYGVNKEFIYWQK